MGAELEVSLTAHGAWSLPGDDHVLGRPNGAEAAAEHIARASNAELRAEALLAEILAEKAQ